MKNLFVLFFMGITLFAQAQTADLCTEIKKIATLADGDAEKVRGKVKTGDDYMTTYETPVKFPGAEMMEAKFFTEGRLHQVIGHYAIGKTGDAGDKVYKELVAKFKACFPAAEELDYPHELGYKAGWTYSDEDDDIYYSFWVVRSIINADDPDAPAYGYAKAIVEF